MLDFSTKAQLNLLEWIRRGAVELVELDQASLDRLLSLTHQFEDVPIDLADATLIVASELLNIREVASVDGDFYVYRDIRNRYLTNVFM